MPEALAHPISDLEDVIGSVFATWRSFPEGTRILIALAICALFIYSGSKSDHGAFSGACFFLAFLAFAYVLMVGISTIG